MTGECDVWPTVAARQRDDDRLAVATDRGRELDLPEALRHAIANLTLLADGRGDLAQPK
jgi:hypothetical protein